MSGFAFIISLVVFVQCVQSSTYDQLEPEGPEHAQSRINRLKYAFVAEHEKAMVTPSPVGTQCYGSGQSYCPSTTANSGKAGCCGTSGSTSNSGSSGCASGLVCGGTSADNQYWAGCRAAQSTYSTPLYCTSGTTPTGPPAPAPGPPAPAPGPPSGGGTVTTGTAGITTRYWDCCKPSCSWSGKAAVNAPVNNCAKDGNTVISSNTASICNGGTAYMCNKQQPVNVTSTLAYGFAAADIGGKTEADWCSACYELTFTSTAVSGQRLIVQVTNTGGDLGNNQFDLELPGGGVGLYNGCTSQWGAPSSGWGSQYGGVSSASQCSTLPSALQSGCNFRFGWFKGADNPSMSFRRVRCPPTLTAASGSTRSDDSSYAYASGAST